MTKKEYFESLVGQFITVHTKRDSHNGGGGLTEYKNYIVDSIKCYIIQGDERFAIKIKKTPESKRGIYLSDFQMLPKNMKFDD